MRYSPTTTRRARSTRSAVVSSAIPTLTRLPLSIGTLPLPGRQVRVM